MSARVGGTETSRNMWFEFRRITKIRN